jgi:ADP-heptose:LPS heptosyltransferase
LVEKMAAIKLLKVFDEYLIGAAVGILGIFARKGTEKDSGKTKTGCKSIAFIKLWAIGDAVNTLPMIKSTKEKYPDSRITVITKKSLIPVYRQQFIDEVITTDIKDIFRFLFSPRRYDLVFDLEPHLNSSAVMAFYIGKMRIGFSGQARSRTYNHTVPFSKEKHIVMMYMDMLRFIGINKKINALVPLSYSSKTQKDANKIMIENSTQKNDYLIGFCAGVGSMVKEREWGKENYRRLAERLLKQKSNIKIILTGTKEDSHINQYIKDNNPRIIDLSGQMNLETLFAFMKNIDIFVSNDTGPMHIAAAQGCRTIGLFGPNTPKIWGPYGKNNVSIFHPKKGCPFLDNTKHELVPKKLTKEQKTCMDAISVEEVYREVKRLI